ncbi:MAG: phosphatidylglycerol lysyltransferase domain-containing protein [Sphaerochaetaceae bacterium]
MQRAIRVDIMIFHQPTLADQPYFTVGSSLLAYEYQFSYCILWERTDHITVAETDIGLYIHNRIQDAFLYPITNDIDKAMDELKEYCLQTGTRFALECVPKEQAEELELKGYHIEHTRDLDDYLYNGMRLVTLSGKHLQSKRNHISQFKRDYHYEAQPMTKEDIPDVMSLDWCWIQCNTDDKETEEERMAIKQAFRFWDELGFLGTSVRIDGKMVAFCIGQIIDKKLAISHFEKADTKYAGVYSVINQAYANMYLADIEYVNRQEDMGLEGLRKSKLSYHPAMMVEKYNVTEC